MSEQKPSRTERQQDKAVEDTFPASDAAGEFRHHRRGASREPHQPTPIQSDPTGTPTSDRHADGNGPPCRG